jgi:MFS family permease
LFAALRNRNFRLLWLGTLSAFLGFVTSNVVQSVVAFQLTSRNQSVGFVVFARGAAQLLLAPIGGAVADRFSKRTILISSQSLTAIVFWVLAFIMHAGKLQVSHLTISGFVIGMTFAFLGPTRSAYSLELSEPEWRGNASALNQVAVNLSRIAGPALASLLLGWDACGPTGAFLAMGGLYALAVLTQYRLPTPEPTPKPGRGLLADLRDGVAYVRGNAPLRALLLTFTLAVMLGFPYVTMLPGYVEHQLGHPSSKVSVLFSVSAAGGLLASVLAAWIASSRHLLLAYRISGFAFALSLVLPWFAHDMRLAAVMFFFVGFCSGSFTTLNGAVLLQYTDARYMGRVVSIAMLSFGAFGLIGLPASALADILGEGTVMALLGILVFVLLAAQSMFFAAPAPALGELPGRS